MAVFAMFDHYPLLRFDHIVHAEQRQDRQHNRYRAHEMCAGHGWNSHLLGLVGQVFCGLAQRRRSKIFILIELGSNLESKVHRIE
jgi:hypothetical protein